MPVAENAKPKNPTVAPIPPLAVKPRVACQLLSCGNSKLYGMLSAGELIHFRDGGSRKITVASIEAYIARRIASSADIAEKIRMAD